VLNRDTVRPVAQVRVSGFLPSTSGLHFTNYYPHEPEIQIKLPFGPTLSLGDAANGLCGGMALVSRDYFEVGKSIPSDTEPPPPATPLYRFIVRRLMDSFNLPFGLTRYAELMHPAFPDVGPGFGLPGRASVMVRDEWPHIQNDLDGGHPVPLGLIKVISANPHDLCKNHQVLAYGYDLDDDDGTDLTLHLYDPNYANTDDVTLQLGIASVNVPVSVTYTPAEPVYCFFRTPYSAAMPPGV
jgi:hypothetical protein